MARDLHQALKTDIVKQASGGGCNFTLVRMQWGKNEIGNGLHANPNTFGSSGIQRSDFLKLLGFERRRCSFILTGECYSQFVSDSFDLDAFIKHFDEAYNQLLEAERDLNACGYSLPQPEGWGYFFGRPSGRSHRSPSMVGDGHTAGTIKQLKASEDETFRFALTWLDTGRQKGWTIHYRPKHPPLSQEIAGIFQFLGVSSFKECPQFDFEECHWRSVPFEQLSPDIPFGANTQDVHYSFDSHEKKFSPGIQKLLSAHVLMEKAGLRLLPFPEAQTRYREEIQQRVIKPTQGSATARRQPVRDQSPKFDVAISFAGSDRSSAEELANRIRQAGFAVFYDEFYPEVLWGKDLTEFFDEVFRKESRYCVIFASKEYLERPWTIHERRSAMARALQERGGEYILPIKVDDVELPGLHPTIGYIPLNRGIAAITDLLIKKLGSPS